MTRRSFIKGLLALPVGLSFRVLVFQPEFLPVKEWVQDGESHGFYDVPQRNGQKGWKLKSTDYESACAESRQRAIEAYFAPNPMFESLRRSS